MLRQESRQDARYRHGVKSGRRERLAQHERPTQISRERTEPEQERIVPVKDMFALGLIVGIALVGIVFALWGLTTI